MNVFVYLLGLSVIRLRAREPLRTSYYLIYIPYPISDRYIPTVRALRLFGLPSPGSIDPLFRLTRVPTGLK